MRSFPAALAVAAVSACFKFAAAADKAALPWPAQHTHTEMMYTPLEGSLQKKPVYYDFPNKRYRADQLTSQGVKVNSTSYWFGDDLYIYDFRVRTCQHLNMGFGMMIPDWFLIDGFVVPQGPVWHTHKYDGTTIAYEPTVFNSKASPDGNFSYYSSTETGYGFVMHAPSPAGIVVNEYYDWAVADFSDPAQAAVFDRPTSPNCTSANATGLDAVRYVRKHFAWLAADVVAALPRELADQL